MKDRSY